MAKYDVFISYSRNDSKVVSLVVGKLKDAGLNVWIDEDGIESGDLFKRVITNAIENSACLLFFSSFSSNKSSWTAKEIGIANYENVPIIPVLLDDSKYNPEIKFDLINRDFVNMKSGTDYDRAITRIIKSIQKLLAKTGSVDSGQKKIETPPVNNCKQDNVSETEDNTTPSDKQEQPQLPPIPGSPEENPQTDKENAFKNILQKAFSARYIHLSLLCLLIVFTGVIGITLYPLILVIYYEIRRKKGKYVPAFYQKYRTGVIALSCIFYAILIIFGAWLVYDNYAYDSRQNDNIYKTEDIAPVISAEYVAENIDSAFNQNETNDVAVKEIPIMNPAIYMEGNVDGKAAELILTPSEQEQISVELIIDGVKFHYIYADLIRRHLYVSLVNDDGTYIGSLDGILTINNGSVVFKGDVNSQGITKLFSDGKFEFKGIANDAIIRLCESQTAQ